MRTSIQTLALLSTALVAMAGCGSTATPNRDGSHHFNDGTVFDASPLDGGVNVDAEPQGPACDDGVDNDNDGLTDYPDDPGCSDATDIDESNPPFCGLDNHGEMIEIRSIPPTGHLVQNTDNGHNFHSGSCGGDGAPELVFKLTITGATSGVLINTIGTPTLLDTVVYVRKDTCDASTAEVACKASTIGAGVEVGLTDPDPGDYYIFVDGHVPGQSGQFLLEIRGLIPEGQPCDPTDQTLVCTPGLICAEPDTGPPTVCVVPRCSDGLDNDGDTIIDFPFEPGCESALDHTEDDTCPGVGCPQCADATDNDNDGLTDWPNDPGCTGAGDPIELDECLTGLQLTELPATGVYSGTVDTALPSLASSSCLPGLPNNEVVFPLSLPYGAVRLDVNMTMLSGFAYPNLFVRAEECASGTELACEGTDWSSATDVSLPNLPAGTYYIFADAYEAWSNDIYDLTVQVFLPVGAPCEVANALMQCGDGSTCQDVGGTWECVPTQCNNGLDDDLDGYFDYPNDPGCDSINDNDEADSCDPIGDPASCPACFNGLDDDGDGLVDDLDPGCTSAADTSEIDECSPGLPITNITASGVASGLPVGADTHNGSCGWAGYPEDVFLLWLTEPAAQVNISLQGNIDYEPVVYARHGDCADLNAELGCTAASNPTWDLAELTLFNVNAGRLFVFADANYSSITGQYNLSVNAILHAGSTCDASSTVVTCPTGTTCTDPGGGHVCQ